MDQESKHPPKRIIITGTGIGGAGMAALMARQGMDVFEMIMNDLPDL